MISLFQLNTKCTCSSIEKNQTEKNRHEIGTKILLLKNSFAILSVARESVNPYPIHAACAKRKFFGVLCLKRVVRCDWSWAFSDGNVNRMSFDGKLFLEIFHSRLFSGEMRCCCCCCFCYAWYVCTYLCITHVPNVCNLFHKYTTTCNTITYTDSTSLTESSEHWAA